MMTAKKPRYLVEDIDERSRTVALRDRKLDIEPDVEVNSRSEIMADEGPVAETNPHNQTPPEEPPPKRAPARRKVA